jgi:endonuclease YncB( thermonuclease family)
MARRAFLLTQFLALIISLCVPALAASPQNMSFVVVKRATSSLAILLENGKSLRLVGLDSFPASEDAAKDRAGRAEAAEYLNKLVAGKRIWLEYEPTRVDKAGNMLGYVFLLDNGAHVNAEMIKKGYATAFTSAYYKHRDEFEKLQKNAEKEKSGLWASYVAPAPKKPVRPAEPVARAVDTAQSSGPDLSFDSGDTRGPVVSSTPSSSKGSVRSAGTDRTDRNERLVFIDPSGWDKHYHTASTCSNSNYYKNKNVQYKRVPVEEAVGYTRCPTVNCNGLN